MKEIIDIETRGVEHMIINISDYSGGREISLFQDSTRIFCRIGFAKFQSQIYLKCESTKHIVVLEIVGKSLTSTRRGGIGTVESIRWAGDSDDDEKEGISFILRHVDACDRSSFIPQLGLDPSNW